MTCELYWCLITLKLGFPDGAVMMNPPTCAGDASSILESGKSPGGENGNPLQYSFLENPWTEKPGGLQFMGSKELDMT